MGTHRRSMLELAPVRENRVTIGDCAARAEPHAVVDSVVVVTFRDIEGGRNVVRAEAWLVCIRDRRISECRQEDGCRCELQWTRPFLRHCGAVVRKRRPEPGSGPSGQDISEE